MPSHMSLVTSRQTPVKGSNSFRFTQFRKNVSVSPLESHTFKTKDLKCPVFTHFQKKGGGPPPVKSKERGRQEGNSETAKRRRPSRRAPMARTPPPHSKRAGAASTSAQDCGINGTRVTGAEGFRLMDRLGLQQTPRSLTPTNNVGDSG